MSGAQSRYRKGAAKERQLKHKLEMCGWYVMRSAGSKGALDLIAIRDGCVVGFQVKVGGIGRAEIGELCALAKAVKIPIYAALWDSKRRRWKFISTDGSEVAFAVFKPTEGGARKCKRKWS